VRLYDPTYGRFMSVDPLWEGYASFSPYIYCRNNPISRTDASGLGDEEICSKPVVGGLLSGGTPPTCAVVGSPTPRVIGGAFNLSAYNCHSFAWSDGKGDPNDPANNDIAKETPLWDQNPMNNAEVQSVEIPFDSPNQVGDRVIYFNEGKSGKPEPTHSAVVVQIDEKGNAILVMSKWGERELLLHHPRDVPDIYSGDNPNATTSTGQPYQTRRYYRAKDKAVEKKEVESTAGSVDE